jgi:hypothetical protein
VKDLSDPLEGRLENTEWFIFYQTKEIGAEYEKM